jgi:hypothetical protein
MNGVGPITEGRLIAAYDLGGTVPASHFGFSSPSKGRNRLPTLLFLDLVSWVPGSNFTTVSLTHKGRQFVSELLPKIPGA